MDGSEEVENRIEERNEDVCPSFVDEHEAFAASRSTQFAFVPNSDYYFAALDQHADTLEADVKAPLVILGPEGSGKSAFLAGWVAQRRKSRDEFLFQHFVGSSANSCELAHTLFRLETALKDFFQLREMEIPDTEDRLRWSLNRFLGAAAKKHFPARIVIIIDGVNKLKGEGGREGELYWLPTELPPCVRFIVSTVEFDRDQKCSEKTPHRTFVELTRRQCPVVKMEELSGPTRLAIFQKYYSAHCSTKFQLSDTQQSQIVSLNATAQPLFLRALLQSLRLGMLIRNCPAAGLLDIFVKCNTAFELIDQLLYMCSRPFANTQLDDEFSQLLNKVLTVVYVSNNGLSVDELWGVIKMVTKNNDDVPHADKLFLILQDFTMVVNGLHSYSHEVYKEVVYTKYICDQETLVRWHIVMSKFFGALPPCDRKLECLPHHLEVAGSWTKVKNCLTDIDMFELWWTPKFKVDFIKLWSSLTSRNHGNKKRPTFDIVEEYVKSLDEFRNSRAPSDERVSEIILLIADFLIEFATLGHELNADVPALIHPPIPSDDLKALGVPHIVTDDDGVRSCLIVPVMGDKIDDGIKALSDAPIKPDDNCPQCTTYYFHRWMWIQFPYIALGNCGARYQNGIHVMNKQNSTYDTNTKGSLSDDSRPRLTKGQSFLQRPTLARTWSAASYKLPDLKFVRKTAKSQRKIANPDDYLESNGHTGDAVSRRLDSLNEEIQTLRGEYDFMYQQRKTLSKRLDEMKANLKELIVSEESGHMYDKSLQIAIDNDNKGQKKLENVLTLHKNLEQLLMMCQRHPAHCPAIIQEIERKIEQDQYLINEIKSRLWEQKFEGQSHAASFKTMNQLVQEGVDMHAKLYKYRTDMKNHLQKQAADDAKAIALRSSLSTASNNSAHKHNSRNFMRTDTFVDRMDLEIVANNWDRTWQVISMRTGITDPDIFFQRQNNSETLKEQINQLKVSADKRLAQLKNEVIPKVEKELEEVRNEASFVGGQTRDTYQRHKELATVQQKVRRIKERTEAAEQLQQQVIAGLKHISELLGVPERDENAPIPDLVRDIETVLDTLIEEREKQQQGQTSALSVHSDTNPGHRVASPGQPETHGRPAELESVLTKFELPKARLAATLPTRPVDVLPSTRDDDEELEDEEEEGMWDRKFAKQQSTKKSAKNKKISTSRPSKAEIFA